MVPTTVSKLMPVGVGGSGYMQTPGYQPASAYDLRTHSKIQRGFVGIRVAYPHSSLQALSALPKVTKGLYAGPQISYAPTADAGGYYMGGGGGAGNLLVCINQTLAAGTYEIKVGKGQFATTDLTTYGAGYIEGINDVNTNLGLPPIPRLTKATETSNAVGEDSVSNSGNENATASTAYKVVLPAGLAIPICDTQLFVIEKRKPASAEKAPCESFESIKKLLGADSYAALEVPFFYYSHFDLLIFVIKFLPY